MKNLGWTKTEDTIIAAMNHLFTDPYGLVTQKALESYRPFPFQSAVTAPSIPNRPQSQGQGQGKGQMTLNAHGQLVPAPPIPQPYTFPIRTPKQVLDRVTWQQKSPQDEIFSEEEITSNPRFGPYLVEFASWKSGSNHRKRPREIEKEKSRRTDLLGLWVGIEKDSEYRCRDTVLSGSTVMDIGGDLSADCSAEEDEVEAEARHEDKDDEVYWDGRNKMYFSSGAKSAWWGLSYRNPPSSGSRSVLFSTQLSASLPPIEVAPVSVAVPSPVDLESFLLAGTDGYADDMDLGFEFGVDDAHEDLLVVGAVKGDTVVAASSSSSSSSSSSFLTNSYLDPILNSGKMVTERLFSCSTDYNLDNDTRTSQTQSKKTNIVVSVMRKAIKDSERRKPVIQALPGMEKACFLSYTFFLSSISCY